MIVRNISNLSTKRIRIWFNLIGIAVCLLALFIQGCKELRTFGEIKSPPILVAPQDQSIIKEVSILFQWEETGYVDSYILEIYFQDKLIDLIELNEISSLEWDVPSGFQPGEYTWRVIAENEFQRAQSNVYSFTFECPTHPPVVEYSSLICDTLAIFSWDEQNNVDSYQLELWNDDTNEMIYSSIVNPATLFFEQRLSPGHYLFKIQALDPICGLTPGTEKTFTVVHELPEVNLLSPSDEQVGPGCVQLEWEEIAEIDTYKLEISTDGFVSSIDGYPQLCSTTLHETHLTTGTYQWRVTALSGGCEKVSSPFSYYQQPYSDTTLPTITLESPLADTLLDGKIYITGHIEDDYGLAYMEWKVSSKAKQQIMLCGKHHEFAIPFDLSSLSCWKQFPRIEVDATDAAGNSSLPIILNDNMLPSTCGPNSVATLSVTRLSEWGISPGNFANSPYNNPEQIIRRQNSPVDKELMHQLSLGFWGGKVILHFHNPIKNIPGTPSAGNTEGLDFIIYTNAQEASFWEPAYVEVSKDENENGLPDDPWYLIKGSDANLLSNKWVKEYDLNDPASLPSNKNFWYISSPWLFYPDHITFEGYYFSEQDWSLFPLTAWGYAEVSLTREIGEWHVPDDPFTLGVDTGSRGGDAMDIAWAVDPDTGAEVVLEKVHFIRITNGILDEISMGGISSELYGVSRVLP
jgi:hypothetical protein